MSLLGTPLVVILAVAAVLLPVATFLLWGRVRGPRPVRAGARLGMLGAGQVATLLLVAALANDYGQFYTSWGDLVGSPGGGISIRTYGGLAPSSASSPWQPRPHHTPTAQPPALRIQPASVPSGKRGASGQLQVLGNTSWSTRSQWATKGKVEQVRITGLGSGLSELGYVYLPPQYFQAKYAHRSFPAVETIGGYPGTALAQVTRMNYPGVSQQLVGQHRSTPMVFVMLSSVVAPPRDTEGTNIPGGPQAETYFAREVPSAVQSALRVTPHDWGISGDSTGGYIATKVLMHHPQTFAGAVSLSGYYHALSDVTTGNLWGGSLAVKHANDPEWLLAHRAAPPVSLFVTITKQENSNTEGYADTMKFVHEVKPPMRVTAMVLDNGGHNFNTWGRELPTALTWLSHRLGLPRHIAPAPAHSAAGAPHSAR
ncbi:MAG TPA: alpha/beta hydrolase-fold protein [Segeticoccus sp.]|uniref:alpha/beta hydrolase n=1 Tax=Segeticoccus sp. TaxID=2706531 RepID=UPI002D7EF628|nr:alpha/beta hydrolase-fold protein [Segeticoccus sp.]HET8602277.1 alpha/beta hydrolase-fold protein [Segeticoccus sp.]